MLSLKQVQDVCLLHKGADQCRYLEQDSLDYTKFHCLKKSSKDKKKIDDFVDQHLRFVASTGQSLSNTMTPISDNCSGYIILKSLEQGYDKDKK